MSNITDIFDNISSLYPDPSQRITMLISMFSESGYDPTNRILVPTVNETTATSLRIVTLSYISAAISELEFDSSSQAQRIMALIKPLFEAQMGDNNLGSQDFFRLQRLYSKTLADISTRGSILPQVVNFYVDPNDNIPLNVLAQYIYQDGSQADDILLRNNDTIVHPLFVNTSIEVLNNG